MTSHRNVSADPGVYPDNNVANGTMRDLTKSSGRELLTSNAGDSITCDRNCLPVANTVTSDAGRNHRPDATC